MSRIPLASTALGYVSAVLVLGFFWTGGANVVFFHGMDVNIGMASVVSLALLVAAVSFGSSMLRDRRAAVFSVVFGSAMMAAAVCLGIVLDFYAVSKGTVGRRPVFGALLVLLLAGACQLASGIVRICTAPLVRESTRQPASSLAGLSHQSAFGVASLAIGLVAWVVGLLVVSRGDILGQGPGLSLSALTAVLGLGLGVMGLRSNEHEDAPGGQWFAIAALGVNGLWVLGSVPLAAVFVGEALGGQ